MSIVNPADPTNPVLSDKVKQTVEELRSIKQYFVRSQVPNVLLPNISDPAAPLAVLRVNAAGTALEWGPAFNGGSVLSLPWTSITGKPTLIEGTTNQWSKDSSGKNRIYFAAGGALYLQGGDAAGTGYAVVVEREPDGAEVLWILQDGSVRCLHDASTADGLTRLGQVQTLANAAKLQVLGNVTLTGLSLADFGPMPAGLRRIHIEGVGLSTVGTSAIIAQIQDSAGAMITAGYAGCSVSQTAAGVGGAAFSSGFHISDGGQGAGATLRSDHALTQQLNSNVWMWSGISGDSSSVRATKAIGSVSSVTVKTLRITTANGEAFDSGSVTVWGEF